MYPVRTLETQCSHSRFMEMLPKACGSRPYEIVRNTVVVFAGQDRQVNISIGDESIRHLGSLDLPMERAQFEFVGFSEMEADDFMDHFREHNMRAGGG